VKRTNIRQADFLQVLDVLFEVFFEDPWEGHQTSGLDGDGLVATASSSEQLGKAGDE
jgi:hypothetical protein